LTSPSSSNALIDPVSSLDAIEAELEEEGVTARPPRKPEAPLFDAPLVPRDPLPIDEIQSFRVPATE
jgi:hypothetical protein